MRRAILLLATLVPAAALVSPAGRAAVTRDIEVRNFAFVPAVIHADQGDTIRWNWAAGFHSVTADDGSFDSGAAPAPGRPPFTITFGGGTVLYHCAVHPGPMRGKITDDPAPAIDVTTPSDGEVVTSPVAVTGTAIDNGQIASVTVSASMHTVGLLPQTVAAGCTAGCGTGSISWSASLPFLPGVYSLFATVTDDMGIVVSTPPITVVVV